MTILYQNSVFHQIGYRSRKSPAGLRDEIQVEENQAYQSVRLKNRMIIDTKQNSAYEVVCVQ